MDLAFFRKLAEDYSNWWRSDWRNGGKGEYPNSLTIDTIIQHNGGLVTPTNLDEIINADYGTTWKDELKYDVDQKLAKHFPIIGVGTEKIVFDIGTAVLKRYVSDGRGWEMALDDFADTIPGLFSPNYVIPVSDSEETILIQEKLTPISASENQNLILQHYPSLATEFISTKYSNWKFWEWGLDSNGIPHIYDWG